VKQLTLETGDASVDSPLPRPPRSLLWIDELAVEVTAKMLRVLTFTKAVDIEPNCIAIEEVPARTERHALAELLNADPIGTGAAVCGNGNVRNSVEESDIWCMVTPIRDKCGRPMAWRQGCTDFGVRVHGYWRGEVAHFGCRVVHGYWNKPTHSGRTSLRILHAVRVGGFWISRWRAVREVERCPVVHSGPAIHRGSDLRRARSASASVRQFSHRASNLLSSSSSSSARSPAERSFRSLRISCMCLLPRWTIAYVRSAVSACKGSNSGDRNPLLAMSRRLGILCGARLGTCA
jgi:hypothetical protein